MRIFAKTCFLLWKDIFENFKENSIYTSIQGTVIFSGKTDAYILELIKVSYKVKGSSFQICSK